MRRRRKRKEVNSSVFFRPLQPPALDARQSSPSQRCLGAGAERASGRGPKADGNKGEKKEAPYEIKIKTQTHAYSAFQVESPSGSRPPGPGKRLQRLRQRLSSSAAALF